jgi:hypothetical protein
MIANLHEFNQLQYKFNLNGTKFPSVSASLAVAKSAIRQAPHPEDFCWKQEVESIYCG